MRRGFDLTQYEAAARKRTAVSAFLILGVIPVTVLGGSFLLGSDLYMIGSILIVIYTMIPFFMVFERRKPKAREIVLIAMMAALTVVIHLFFHLTVPIQAGTAMIIISGISLGPEAGFMIGALARFVCNFYMGQGPWTPWQMFCWGLIGFLTGLMKNAGLFSTVGHVTKQPKSRFVSPRWDRLCPPDTTRGDLLAFVRQTTERAPTGLCLWGLATGFVYGWIMNVQFIFGYVNPITWQTVAAAYVSSFFFDLSHGVCTFLVLWALASPWSRKLERVKEKFGLVAERDNYVMPPAQGLEGGRAG